MPARAAALRVLTRCRRDSAYADAALKEEIARGELSSRDAALCTQLVSGVLQNRALLDYCVDGLLRGSRKLRPVLRDILRLGAYQILLLTRVPDSAAVNESVKLCRHQHLSEREAGLVNGVLRSLAREKDALELPKDYAIRYSHPAPLVDLMKQSVGKNLGSVLAADNQPPETAAQWNPLRGSEAQLLAAWDAEQVAYTPHSWLRHCYLLRGTGNLEELPSFRQGRFQIQDPAARLAVDQMGLEPGAHVLDLCAAPGGKSLAAGARMENLGEIISCDVHAGKLDQIASAARRLGVTVISTAQNDGTQYRPEWAERFDAVIADVPCSGLGVIRKKPDIRYKDLGDLAMLPGLQRQILEQAGRYVRPGGVLLYSTCTILRRENEDVVQGFLQDHPEYRPGTLELPEPLETREPGMLTLYQGVHDCDGFFIAKLIRQ